MNPGTISYLFGFEISFLLVGLALTRFFSVSLKKFVPFYFLLVAGKALIASMTIAQSEVVPIIIAGAGGLVILLIMTGFLGTTFSSRNYEAIALSIGLFPWYLDKGISLAYLVIALVLITAVSEYRVHHAFSLIDYSYMPLRTAKKKLSEENYEKLMKNGSTLFAVPIMISAILSMILLLT